MSDRPDVTPRFFASPVLWRRWLERHHAREKELWVGFHKRATGKPSLTWPESVDEALCYGWIDGLRRSCGAESYMIRFTPRRAGSTWSAVNVRRVAELTRLGRMRRAGLAVFEARSAAKTAVYSFEQRRTIKLPRVYARRFRANAAAWRYFTAKPPWYQRTAAYWIVSAKREETRLKRLDTLIADSAAGRSVGPLRRGNET